MQPFGAGHKPTCPCDYCVAERDIYAPLVAALERLMSDAPYYANAPPAENNNVTLQEAEKVYQPKRSWWARFCDWLDRG